MKKYSVRFAAALLAVFAFAAPSFADDDSTDSFGTRYNAGVDLKVAKGFHVSASEELRLDSSFGIDRSYTSLGATYKINDYLKAGLGYDAIAVNKSTYYDWRHRLSLGLTESYKVDQFRFSLKETFQATYRTKDVNTYQTPKTKLTFKTRAKVAYKPLNSRFTPYAQAELRVLLNGANWTSSDGTTYEYQGLNDVYVNRIRFQAGTEYKFDKHNALEVFALYDYIIDKDIDAKRSSATLKTITLTKYPFIGLGFGYVHSF